MYRKMLFLIVALLMLAIHMPTAIAAVETADFEGLSYADSTQILETVVIDGLKFSTSGGAGVDYRTSYGQDDSACVVAHYADAIEWLEFQTSDGSDFALTSLYYNNALFYPNCASEYKIEGYDDGGIVQTMTGIDVGSEASRSGTITFTGWSKVDAVRITALSGTYLDVAATFDNIVYERIAVSSVPYMVANQPVTTVEGGMVSILSGSLQAADNDSDDSTLLYTITSGPAHGRVENVSTPGSAITSFTQGDINSGSIRYVHDHSDTTSDSFVFKVSDGVNELTNRTFNITVTPVYDDPIPSGASVATFDGLAGTFLNGASIPYSTAIDGFLFRSSADLGMLYLYQYGQDNTPSLTTYAPGTTIIPTLTIKKADEANFKLISIYLFDRTAVGASEYTFEGYRGTDKIYTKSNVNVFSPVTVVFNWENINEIRVTAVTGARLDIAAYFDNIVYQNENSAPTDITLSNVSIAENAAPDASIGTLSTTDADTGDTFTYSLAAGAGDTDNSSFVIDGDTLKLNSVLLDYETKNSYSILVKTTDSGGLTFEKNFIITVTDVDESTAISLAGVTGIIGPSAGIEPAAYSSLVPGDASYTATDLYWQNADGSAATYVNGKFKAASAYKAVIELTAAVGYKFPAGGLTPTVDAGTSSLGSVSGGDVSGNKLTFTVAFDATAPLSVMGIAVTSQPVLSYIEGQALDLTGLEVTLTYNDTSTEQNIGPALFSAKGITANPANETSLSIAAHNAQTVQLSCNGQTAQTSALTVTAATYTISASPDSLAFGSMIEGYASAPAAQTVTVTNDGNSAVTLSLPTVTGYTLGTLSTATLASGESATFTVQPTTGLGAGTHSETITVSTDQFTSADVGVSFTVQSASYAISADPASLSFGSMIEGYATAPAAQTVTVTNEGNSAVTLSLPTVTGYTLGTLSTATLASGESATFTVQPATGLGTGAHSQTITVSTDHSTSVDVGVSFTVQSASYAISADPASLSFGSMIEGYASAPAAQTVTVTNEGNSAVTLSLPTVTGYTLGTLSTATLASGESATFTVQPATGLDVGTHSETITVSTDHSTSVDVSVSFTVQPASYAISADPASLSFGSMIEGYASAPAAQMVTVTNEGNSAVTLSLPTVTGYTLGTLSTATLASGESATFTVQPATGLGTGAHSQTITVSTDHSTSVDVGVSFTVQSASYAISADPASLSFGSMIEGYATAPAAQTVTVTNEGNSAVTLSLPTVTGYTLGTLSTATLASGESATFTVQPATGLGAGTHSETITVSTDQFTSADVGVSFTVQSASYVIEASTDSLDFGSLVEGYALAPAAQTVTITNKGNKNVTLITPSSTAYDISTTDSLTVAPDGAVQFSVRPNVALGVGNHNETIVFSTTSSTSDSITVSFTVQSASYAISAAPLLKTFTSAAEGTVPPAGETFTVSNIGNMAVTLTQPTATDFIIGTLSAFSIDPMETATFTVAPKAGLAEGSYTETITIQGSNGAIAQAEVRFTVTEALSYAIDAAPASIAFDSLAQGYLLPDAKTVTVTNTGNQSISLYQPTASRYTIGMLSSTALAPAGTATFTIVPKEGLAAGAWNETIHIMGSNGVNSQVEVVFTCTEPLDYFIISGNGSTYQQDDPNSPNITLTANGDFNKFTGLTLNGDLVDESNYDVREGSTIVTLHQDFLDTLIPGTYTLIFHYTDGQAQADFVVQDQMPVTGDNDALVLFGTLIVLCLAALILIRKKLAPR